MIEGLAPSNGSRLSCAALKKYSFHSLRAASAPAACYAGAQLLSKPIELPFEAAAPGRLPDPPCARAQGPAPYDAPKRDSTIDPVAQSVVDPRTRPTAPPKGFALGGAQHNGSRLSCGALKNDSFNNLRAPSASSAC